LEQLLSQVSNEANQAIGCFCGFLIRHKQQEYFDGTACFN